jgi:hypothetical protein
MNQIIRFFVSPKVFFNQLQYSTRHYLILFVFLVLAGIETFSGQNSQLYLVLSNLLQRKYHLSLEQALWTITFTKLLAMISGAYVISMGLWFLGKILGISSSQRVLARRLSVVFTVFISAYTLNNFFGQMHSISYIVTGIYIWGMILTYYAVREQFHLNHIETTLACVITLLLTVSVWHFSGHAFKQIAQKEYSQSSVAVHKVIHKKAVKQEVRR